MQEMERRQQIMIHIHNLLTYLTMQELEITAFNLTNELWNKSAGAICQNKITPAPLIEMWNQIEINKRYMATLVPTDQQPKGVQ